MKVGFLRKVTVLTTVLSMVFATTVFAEVTTDATGTIPTFHITEKTETMKMNVIAGSTFQISNDTDAPLAIYFNNQPSGVMSARIPHPTVPGSYLVYGSLGDVSSNGTVTAKYKKNSHTLYLTMKEDTTAQKANIKALIEQYTVLKNNAAAMGDANTQLLCQQVIDSLKAQLAALK